MRSQGMLGVPQDLTETSIAFKLKPETDRHRIIVSYSGLNNLTNAPGWHGRKARARSLIDGPEGGHTRHVTWIGCAIPPRGRNIHLM
ncbi:hypothetical protein BDV12DRAFT_190275 [Aspergillus spectabilis]